MRSRARSAAILAEPAVEFGDALLGAGLFAFERVARHHEPLQRGGGSGLGLAQGRQAGGDGSLAHRGFGLLAGAVGDDAHGQSRVPLGGGDLDPRRDPAQMEQQRFGAAHLRGNVAVARRLPRLGLEAGNLAGQLADHVLGPLQIVLGGPQPQLGLVAPGVQAGNAGRFLEHAPARSGRA